MNRTLLNVMETSGGISRATVKEAGIVEATDVQSHLLTEALAHVSVARDKTKCGRGDKQLRLTETSNSRS